MSFHKQSRKYFNSIMNYNFEEGIFIDIKEESVFLRLDCQLEDLKEQGLKLSIVSIYTRLKKMSDRLMNTIEEIDSKHKILLIF